MQRWSPLCFESLAFFPIGTLDSKRFGRFCFYIPFIWLICTFFGLLLFEIWFDEFDYLRRGNRTAEPLCDYWLFEPTPIALFMNSDNRL